MIESNIFFVLAISLTLLCPAQAARAREVAILHELHDGSTSPSRTLALLKELGPGHKGEDDGIDVAALLEASKTTDKECTTEALLERHSKCTMLAYDLGDYNAVIGLLDATWASQLDLCLGLAAKQLEKQFLSKMKQGVRDYIEQYDALFTSLESRHKSKSLGPVDSADLASMALGKFVVDRREHKERKYGKLGKVVRKTREQIRLKLKESCEEATQVLHPINQLLNLIRADSKSAHEIPVQIEHWQRVYDHCHLFNKRLTSADQLEEFDFEELPE